MFASLFEAARGVFGFITPGHTVAKRNRNDERLSTSGAGLRRSVFKCSHKGPPETESLRSSRLCGLSVWGRHRALNVKSVLNPCLPTPNA